MFKIILSIALLSSIAACSGEDGKVFEAQTDALDKAKAVEQQVQEAVEAQRKAMEEQSKK